MNHSAILLSILLLSACANSQQQAAQGRLVGRCEGCEAVFEFNNRTLYPTDTLPDFNTPGTNLKLTGTIYQSDGKTPARDVILYIYHTDESGIYPTRGDEQGWGRRHGYIRGWIKTGPDGRYTFYTQKPGSYPSRSEPAHIHVTVLEPDGKYYWLQDYHFAGDTLLTQNHLPPSAPRGGNNGVLTLRNEGSLMIGERDFILGKNVSGYK